MTRILTADIGGTNSRFGSFRVDESGSLTLEAVEWLPTEADGSMSAQLKKLYDSDFPLTPEETGMAVFAVAGPVKDGRYSKLPLAGWEIDLDLVCKDFPLTRAALINDFHAQALAVKTTPGKNARPILPGAPIPNAPVAVVGAGTGLGKALLVMDQNQKAMVIASEGGHADFPFIGGPEGEYLKFLQGKTGNRYLSGNSVVSGQGLSYLHEFISGEQLEPAQVVQQFATYPQTLEWAARFYGRVCRNYLLETLALGGLYLAGGVAAKAPALVEHPQFKEELRNSATMGELLQGVPVWLIFDENSGLWGAANFALGYLNP